MNAVKIIEEIQQLPDEEKNKVVDFVRHLLPNKDTLEAMSESDEDLPRYKNMDEVRGAIKSLINNA